MIEIYYFDIQKYIQVLHESGKEYLFAADWQRVEECIRRKKKTELIAAGWVKRYIFEAVLKRKDYRKDWRKGKYGKPFFVDKSPNFNYSGNEKFIVYALYNEGEVGVDVEKQRAFPGEAVKGFFRQDEWAYLINHPDDFVRIWTRKEAYLKCIGTGWSEKPEYSVLSNRIVNGEKSYHIEDMELCKDYILSLCHEEVRQEKYQIEEITIEKLCQLEKKEAGEGKKYG